MIIKIDLMEREHWFNIQPCVLICKGCPIIITGCYDQAHYSIYTDLVELWQLLLQTQTTKNLCQGLGPCFAEPCVAMKDILIQIA